MTTFPTLRAFARTLSTAARSTPELVGTAPPHRCYIFLHTPQPPSEYPAKYATPTQRALLLRTMKWGGSVNLAWSKDQPAIPAGPPEEEDRRGYYLTAFAHPRGKLEAVVSLDTVDQVAEQLEGPIAEAAEGSVAGAAPTNSNDVHLYVCTHGARDCRCGDTGGAVAQAIRDELRRRRDANPSDPSTRIKLAEVAHVGGTNMQQTSSCIRTENGEIEPADVPEILDAILASPTRPLSPDEIPVCPRHWRGRMGLSKDEQIRLFEKAYS